MSKYKVLIVDDSAFMRVSISNLIKLNKKFEVIGYARNGLDAIQKCEELKPDLVTMDVKMNVLGGLEALETIMKETPTPVVMLSEFTSVGEQVTFDALSLGAVECFLKSDILPKNGNDKNEKKLDWFFEKLEGAAKAKVANNIITKTKASRSSNFSNKQDFEMVVIGCSTGGPNALQNIIPLLPETFKHPILVAQHMPKGFTETMAKRFDTLSSLKVKEAEDNEVIQNGVVYIAPSGYQTCIENKNGKRIFKVCGNEQIRAQFAPSVDYTLRNCANEFKDKLLAVVLTGMGKDGTCGCEEVKENGGYVITQGEASCVVYGMPKSVVDAGFSDEQIELKEIHKRIIEVTQKNKK